MPNQVDSEFREILATCCDAKGEVSHQTKWLPPNGDYEILLEKFNTGTKASKEGVQTGSASACFRITTEGEEENKLIFRSFWIPPHAKEVGSGMRNLLKLAACLSRRDLQAIDIDEAVDIISDNVGTAVVQINVYQFRPPNSSDVVKTLSYLGLAAESEFGPPVGPTAEEEEADCVVEEAAP